MRVTSSMYYENLYGANGSKLNTELFDVNKQIASGLKIQYASDDVATFTETMRLDNELTTLEQVKKSTESGYKISNQSDVILNDFGTSMDRFRTLLINAANDSNSDASRDAIALELRGLEKHLKNLSNTSINGQYLFSGSAVDIKPISADGTYNGNDVSMNSFLGSNSQQQYNLTGADLFLGEEILVKREVTSNVASQNLTAKYPDFTDSSISGVDKMITSSDTIRDMMGDTDNTSATANDHYFYLRGVKSDGTAFNQKIQMQDDDKIEGLLEEIGKAYGNTPNLKLVNISMNPNGQIVVEDKLNGSSKLDFHMIGAVDFDRTDGNNLADIDDAVYGGNAGQIDNLDGGETNFLEIINPTPPAASNPLHIKEFVSSSFAPALNAATNIDGILYDRTQFTKEGATLSSNVSQIVRDTNAFATPSTKISEVADLTQGTAGTLDGTTLKLVGKDISGVAYSVDINLTASSSFTVTLDTDNDGVPDTSSGPFDIFNMSIPRVATDADNVTYQQLMDIMNVVSTGNTSTLLNNTTGDALEIAAYDSTISNSNFTGNTYLSYDGKIQFGDLLSSATKAALSLHDANSGDFTDTDGDGKSDNSSVMSFNSNNSLTIRDPKTDFFKTIDEMIVAVENHKNYPDSTNAEMRNVGIENAIAMMDDLQEHVSRAHSMVGAQSNTLTNSLERTQMLEISTMTLRSSVIDTDLAEASLRLTQLTLNYEAMQYTVGKVSRLSLVNYL